MKKTLAVIAALVAIVTLTLSTPATAAPTDGALPPKATAKVKTEKPKLEKAAWTKIKADCSKKHTDTKSKEYKACVKDAVKKAQTALAASKNAAAPAAAKTAAPVPAPAPAAPKE